MLVAAGNGCRRRPGGLLAGGTARPAFAAARRRASSTSLRATQQRGVAGEVFDARHVERERVAARCRLAASVEVSLLDSRHGRVGRRTGRRPVQLWGTGAGGGGRLGCAGLF